MIILGGAGQSGIRLQFVPQRHALVARATKAIPPGTEMLFYYGDYCRERAVDMYGFYTPGMKTCTTLSGRPMAKSHMLLSKKAAQPGHRDQGPQESRWH